MIVFLAALLMILGLIGRMVYLMVFDAEYYQKKAEMIFTSGNERLNGSQRRNYRYEWYSAGNKPDGVYNFGHT